MLLTQHLSKEFNQYRSSLQMDQALTQPLMDPFSTSILFQGHKLKSYHGRLGIVVAVIWSTALISGLGMAAKYNLLASFVSLGPNNEAIFGGVILNTWSKWICVMIYSAVSQVTRSLVDGTLTPFVTNVIRDPTVTYGNYVEAQILVTVQNVFLWLVDLFDILLYITMQLQFWIPAIFADVTVHIYLTHKNMKCKTRTLDA